MRVAVIGCGSIGRRYALWAGELGHEVGVCDVAYDRLVDVEKDGIARVFPDIDAVLGWSPQRVIVSTPPDGHETAAVAAINAGIPVLVEKPLAHDLESARRLRSAASGAHAPVHGVCNMRFHPGVAAVRDHLALVGRPLSFRAVFGHRLSQMRTAGGDFARRASAGGGVVMDCVHEFDYLQWMFGPFADVTGVVSRVGNDLIDAEDLARIFLRFESGVIGSLHLDFLMRQKRRGVDVIGSEGTLSWLSVDRAPEQCRVVFGNQTGERELANLASVDPRQPYISMLERFFEGGDDLQTMDEAYAVLAAAMAARDGDGAVHAAS